MWLGPPAVNRKMTDLAFASRGGGLAASGLAVLAPRVSFCRSAASASDPKPQKASRKNARRAGQRRSRASRGGAEARRGLCVPVGLGVRNSLDIKESIEVKHCEGKFTQWL